MATALLANIYFSEKNDAKHWNMIDQRASAKTVAFCKIYKKLTKN